MTQRASVLFETGWISLAIIGVAILVFGLIATAVPTSSDPHDLVRFPAAAYHFAE